MIINNKIKQRLPQHTFQRYGEMLLGIKNEFHSISI